MDQFLWNMSSATVSQNDLDKQESQEQKKKKIAIFGIMDGLPVTGVGLNIKIISFKSMVFIVEKMVTMIQDHS